MTYASENLRFTVYEKLPKGMDKTDAKRMPTKRVWRTLKDTASSIALTLKGKRLGWPEPYEPINGALLTSDDMFRSLDTKKHDADASVLIVNDLEDLGPELGHLLLRDDPHPVIVASEEDLPCRRAKSRIYRGLVTLPTKTKTGNGQLLEPVKEPLMSGYDIEKAGMLSFLDLRTLEEPETRDRIRELLHYIHLQKNAKKGDAELN